eukprot:3355478-Alexandrium_andersonii.AAC.1
MPAAEPSEEHTTESTLVNRCLELYSTGLLSATSVQYILEGAEEDGLQHPAVCSLAVLGSHGRHPSNCQRDLQK